jgi:hypothetical protein
VALRDSESPSSQPSSHANKNNLISRQHTTITKEH